MLRPLQFQFIFSWHYNGIVPTESRIPQLHCQITTTTIFDNKRGFTRDTSVTKFEVLAVITCGNGGKFGTNYSSCTMSHAQCLQAGFPVTRLPIVRYFEGLRDWKASQECHRRRDSPDCNGCTPAIANDLDSVWPLTHAVCIRDTPAGRA